MRGMKLNRGGVLLILAGLGAFFSSLLVIQEFIYVGGSCVGIANTGSMISCKEVTAYDPLKTIGLSSSVVGLLYFLVLFVLLLARHNVATLKSMKFTPEKYLIHAGTIYMVILTFYHLTFLDKICVYCLGIFLMTILLSISEFYFSSYPDMDRIRIPHTILPTAILLAPLVFLFIDLGPDLENECTFEADLLPEYESAYQTTLDHGVNIGDSDAHITVVEYFDPLCSHCRIVYPKIKGLIEKYGDNARFVYQPFLLNQNHIIVHNALYLAADEGKFVELLDKLFLSEEARSGLNQQKLMNFLADLDLDSEENLKKIKSGHYNEQIIKDTENAMDMGIRSTPTFLVNGKKLKRYSTIDKCLQNIL